MAEFETTGVPDEAESLAGIASLHARLRKLILDGVYPPGALLPQEELARTFGVSRTPLREVLRLLQKEGLVEAGHYQRSRVTPFEPETLDTLYAGRIQLETLGIALTVPHMQQQEFDELDAALARMAATHNINDWEEPHRRFHQLLIACVSNPILTTITSYADQSQRYRRLFGHNEINARTVSMLEHEAIVVACKEHNREEAVRRLARHLARTALTVLAHMAPEYEPIAVRTALALAHEGSPTPEETSASKKRSKAEHKSLPVRTPL